MKKTAFTLLAIFLFTFNTYSQTSKCEFLRNEKDEFTGAIKKEIVGKLFKERNNGSIVFCKTDSTYHLRLYYIFPGVESAVVGTNNRMMIKLANDSVLYFSPVDMASGKVLTFMNASTTQLIVNYYASKQQIELFAKYPLKKARVYFTDVYREHEIKEKNAREVMNGANCILK